MNKYKIIISIFLFTFAITTFASTSNGTVDSTYHYAYGEI